MILGVGADLCDSNRIAALMAEFPERFERRVFSEYERSAAQKRPNKALYFAKRFAAKEALSKAMGTGIRGFQFHDLEVVSDALGKPSFRLLGDAKARFKERFPTLTVANIHLSLSDEGALAMAFVVISQ